MDQFENREACDLMIESRQYRNPAAVKKLNLRTVANFAFIDLMSLYILYSEYESAAVAARYADKTVAFRNFSKARLNGTDLYVSMNILSDPTSRFSNGIAQNPEIDAILRSKIKVNLPTVKRYLDLIADNKIASADVSQLLLKIEKQLNITDSQLKSMRRLVQDWSNLTQMQRSLVITRILQFYHKYTKRSELMVFLEDLGKSKGYELRGPIDAELMNLGAALGPGGTALKVLGPLAAAYTGIFGGYNLGRSLVGPKEDK